MRFKSEEQLQYVLQDIEQSQDDFPDEKISKEL